MNKDLRRDIMNCLRVALAPDPGTPAFREYTGRDWKHALGWQDESGLTLYFRRKLEELGAERWLPADVQDQLGRKFEDNRQRVERQAEEFGRINRALEGAGIKYAAFRGFAMFPDYSPDSGWRGQSDLDYLVEPVPQGAEVLLSLGYQPKMRSESYPQVYLRLAIASPVSRDERYPSHILHVVEG